MISHQKNRNDTFKKSKIYGQTNPDNYSKNHLPYAKIKITFAAL